MTTAQAFADLRRFGRPVLTTGDVAVRLRMTIPAASKLLSRLARAGLVLPLRRGLYSLDARIDPLALPEALTGPHPAYVSLQSALHLRGMIGQIPRVIYVVSLGPPRKVQTSVGSFSIHRLAPEVFGGFETIGDPPIKLATAGKALFDVAYLSNVRSRLFARLPELELPKGFRRREALGFLDRIHDRARRAMVASRLGEILRAGSGRI